MTMAEFVNAEDLREGRGCFNNRCGGTLRDDPFGEGLHCEVCQTRFRGK